MDHGLRGRFPPVTRAAVGVDHLIAPTASIASIARSRLRLILNDTILIDQA